MLVLVTMSVLVVMMVMVMVAVVLVLVFGVGVSVRNLSAFPAQRCKENTWCEALSLNASSTTLREVRIPNEVMCITVCFWLSERFLIEVQRKARQRRLQILNELPRNAIRV